MKQFIFEIKTTGERITIEVEWACKREDALQKAMKDYSLPRDLIIFIKRVR